MQFLSADSDSTQKTTSVIVLPDVVSHNFWEGSSDGRKATMKKWKTWHNKSWYHHNKSVEDIINTNNIKKTYNCKLLMAFFAWLVLSSPFQAMFFLLPRSSPCDPIFHLLFCLFLITSDRSLDTQETVWKGLKQLMQRETWHLSHATIPAACKEHQYEDPAMYQAPFWIYCRKGKGRHVRNGTC